MPDSEQLECALDTATEAIISSDYSADNKAKALKRLSGLYKSAGDIKAIKRTVDTDTDQ